MQDSETRSLRRAAIILVSVSALRFGLPLLSDETSGAHSDILEELGSATRGAVADADLRSRPLEPEERIDPNRAEAWTLDRLPGVGSAASAAIVAARDSGVVFRSPEDLLVVRGIGPASLRRIRGFLDLDSPPPAPGRRRARAPLTNGPRVDVNRADATELQSLPGVGPTIAERILALRREGPFQSVEDLSRVPGIGKATVERLRGLVTIGRRP